MKRFIAATGLALLFVPPAFARARVTPEQRSQSLLARVTVYWAGGGRGSDSYTRRHQCSTGVRLRVGHCAVDPRRIPYGSKVILLDGVYTAVDTGRAVINRKAARRAGRTASERNALVIDCFFETKRQALSWANAHPAFMTVQVVAPNCYRTTTAQHPQVSKQSAPQVAAGTVPQIKRIVGGKQPTPQIAAGTVPQTKQVVSGKQLAQQVGAGTVPQPKQVVGGKQLAQQVGAGTVPQPKQIAGGKQLAERVAAGKVPQTKRIVGVDPGPGVDRSRR